MKGYVAPIEKETEANDNFRKVVYTGRYMQLVYMSLKPGEDIGMEVHGNDQFFRVEAGEGTSSIDGHERPIKDGDAVLVPAGAKHNITNSGKEALKLYTIYAAPHHQKDVVAATKEQAESMKEEFDGKTSE